MPETAKPLLEVQDLSIDFDTRDGCLQAVRGMSWHVNAGETVAIVGESGSGKSVSTSAVMGLLDMPPARIRSGRILYEGEDLLHISPARRREINGRRIGMIFQDPLAGLNPVYPVGWQVAETLRAHGVSARQADADALALLRRMGLQRAAERFNNHPHRFSGGQRQRIMIAMAIAMRPNLLIADEPTTALDVTVQAAILDLLKELQRETGMAMLLITHDLAVVARVADRVVVVNGGQVIETGTTAELLASPKHPYTQKLIGSLPLPGRYAHCGAADAKAPSLLAVEKLSKLYDAGGNGMFAKRRPPARALDEVSFELRRGETLGVIGESGSGKSTLARTLMKLEPADGGSIRIQGIETTTLREKEFNRYRRDIQMVFQDPSASLDPRMTVGDIIAEPWTVHRDVVPRDKRAARVAELLEQVDLSPEDARRAPHEFSGGQRQRIAIARALALQPKILICDEAVSALDASVRAQVIGLLKRLKDELGLAYLFIAHNLNVVADFAHRILVMQHGRVVEQGLTAAVFRNPHHPYTRALLAAERVFPHFQQGSCGEAPVCANDEPPVIPFRKPNGSASSHVHQGATQ